MILLIRHALVDACGVFLAGRTHGIHLNEEGRNQAAALSQRVNLPLAAVYTSPMERARETAGALAEGRAPLYMDDDLNEVDFGEWTGLSFDDLNRRPDWIAFNRGRSGVRIPSGEWMLDVQHRVCRALTSIHQRHKNAHVAIVSHGDVLRALVAKVLNVPLDGIDQFAIDPASISVLQPNWRGFEVTRLNCHANCDHCCPSYC
jgi:broad specificity phosphatase PhoE